MKFHQYYWQHWQQKCSNQMKKASQGLLKYLYKCKFLFILLIFVYLFSVHLLNSNKAIAASLDCPFLHPIITAMLQDHIIHSQITVNLEHKTIDQYIKFLDSSKIYLLQSDVNRIKRLMKGIYKNLQQQSCQTLMTIQQIYLKRTKERMEFAQRFLGKNYKLNSKEQIHLDASKRKYPKTKAQLENFQKKYIHFQMANFMVADMNLNEAKQQVLKRYQREFNQLSSRKPEILYANFLYAVARSLDPHSDFLSKDRLEDFEMQMKLFLEGIGASLSSENGYTVIENLIKGGAAEASGLLEVEDKILAVAQGTKGSFVPIIDMPLNEVVQLIRGPKGTKVRLKILRPVPGKKPKHFQITLIRRKINLEENAASIRYVDHVNKTSKKRKKKISVLDLPSFYLDSQRKGRSSYKDVKKLLQQVRKRKADGLVLDLSSNGGGSLTEAVKVAGLFFKTGNVVKTSGKTRNMTTSEILSDKDTQVDYAGPLVILTSRLSASASEIVAGALQDYGRAVIAGADHTYGKGSVQSVINLSKDIGAFKITMGMFFIPGGGSTQHTGVISDIIFPSVYAREDVGEQYLDYSLPPKKIKPFISQTAFVDKGRQAWKKVTKSILKKLAHQSQRRIGKSKDFKEIQDEIKKNKERDHIIHISEILNENEDLKEKKEIAKQKRRDPDFKEKEYMKRADIKEAVNIAADLADLLHSK